MPTYNLKNNVTNEEKTVLCSWKEIEAFLEQEKDWTLVPASALIAYNLTNSYTKTDSDFKGILKNISKWNPKSNITY